MAINYGWYNYLFATANGDFLKIKEIIKQPVNEFLTFINYKIDYNIAEEEEIQKKKNS